MDNIPLHGKRQGILIHVLKVQVDDNCPELAELCAKRLASQGSVLFVHLSDDSLIPQQSKLFGFASKDLSPSIFDVSDDFTHLYTCQDENSVAVFLKQLEGWKRHYTSIVISSPTIWNLRLQKVCTICDLNLLAVEKNIPETQNAKSFLNQFRKSLAGGEKIPFKLLRPEKPSSEVWLTEIANACTNFIQPAEPTPTQPIHIEPIFSKTVKNNDSQNSEKLEVQHKTVISNTETSVVTEQVHEQERHTETIQKETNRPTEATKARLTRRIISETNSHKKDAESNNGPVSVIIVKKFLIDFESFAKYLRPLWKWSLGLSPQIPRFASYIFLVCAFLFTSLYWWPSTKLVSVIPPTPTRIGFLEQTSTSDLRITFKGGENLYRYAKFAIGKQRAMVPTQRQINQYIEEVVAYHNSTASPKISAYGAMPKGTIVSFFPPTHIQNPQYSEMAGAFDYFYSVVEDPYPYITGFWAERGTGGSPQHEGIDIAAKLGTIIRSPIAGTVELGEFRFAGRTVCVIQGKNLLMFAHMDRRFVKSGTVIEKGAALGTVGMTGRTSGPHVHVGYGVEFPAGVKVGRKNYKFTDPMLWFYKQDFERQHSSF